MNILRLLISVTIFLSLNPHAAAQGVAPNFTPLPLWAPANVPGATFSVHWGLVETNKVYLVRSTNPAPQNNAWIAYLTPVTLPANCPNPKWTPTPLKSEQGGDFEVVYGLNCGSKIYLIKFSNRRNVSQFVSILATRDLGGVSATPTGWSPAPIWTNPNPGGSFEVEYLFQYSGKRYLFRLWDKPGSNPIDVLDQR